MTEESLAAAFDRLRFKRVDDSLAVAPPADKPCLMQHSQVSGYSRLRELELFDYLIDAALALFEHEQYLLPCGVPYRLEQGGEAS